jgi:hypothetical protein
VAYSNLRSKLNRAVVAHLISEGCGTAANVIPFLSRTEKTIQNSEPNTVVRARVGKPRVMFSGVYDVVLQITIRGSAVQELADDDAGLQTARLAFEDRVARTYDAMMQSDDGQSLSWTAKSITSLGRGLAVIDSVNDGDMDEFTCLSLQDAGFGDPNPNDQECVWEEVLLFEACCCASNLEGYELTP